MRKAVYLTLALAGAFAMPCLAESEQSLELQMTDGAVRHIRLAELPRIQLTDRTVSITCGTNVIELPRAEVRGYNIGTHDFAGVAATEADTSIAMDGLTISISGLTAGTPAWLYSADGRTVASATADGEGRLSLTAPHPGTYILRTDKSNLKLLLK